MKQLCTLAFVLLLSAMPVAADPGAFYWVDENTDCGGSTMAQYNLQNLFDDIKDGGTLVFPEGATCTHKASLKIDMGANFVIEGNGATLLLMGADGEGGIEIDRSDNFEIRNITLDGGWDNSDCEDAEYEPPLAIRAQLRINRSSNGLILNVNATRSTGDGLEVRSGAETRVSEKIRFVGARSWANHRHGLSVVEAKEVEILGGTFAENCGDTNGSGALISSGIRIEPNAPEELVDGVLIRGVTLRDNIGVGFQIGCKDCVDTTNVRLLDNVIRRNKRGAIRLASGQGVLIQGNLIEEHAESSQGATVWIGFPTRNVVFAGNRVLGVSGGNPAMDVIADTGGTANQARIVGNLFRDINVGETAGPAIRFAADEGRIAGNHFDDLGFEAIVATGARLEISNNTVRGGSKKVISVDGEETRVVDNTLTVTTAGSNSASEAVLAVLQDDNFVRGNTLLCADNNQRGIHFDGSAIAVTNNIVTGCHGTDWLVLPTTPPVKANNARTGGV